MANMSYDLVGPSFRVLLTATPLIFKISLYYGYYMVYTVVPFV
jgi:hypothetical protein